MQIIIPMSGFGERFRKAGYTVPRPLIEIDGKSHPRARVTQLNQSRIAVPRAVPISAPYLAYGDRCSAMCCETGDTPA